MAFSLFWPFGPVPGTVLLRRIKKLRDRASRPMTHAGGMVQVPNAAGAANEHRARGGGPAVTPLALCSAHDRTMDSQQDTQK
jgi:hypothetical protein